MMNEVEVVARVLSRRWLLDRSEVEGIIRGEEFIQQFVDAEWPNRVRIAREIVAALMEFRAAQHAGPSDAQTPNRGRENE